VGSNPAGRVSQLSATLINQEFLVLTGSGSRAPLELWGKCAVIGGFWRV